MDNNIKTLLNYTNSVIHQNKNELLPILNEEAFFKLAYENGLIGIIFHKIKRKNVSDKLYNKLNLSFLSYVDKDLKQQATINLVNNLLNENKIKHIFLKGSHLKKLYIESHMRGMGDIDILVEPEDLEKVLSIFKKNNIKLTSRSLAHDVYITKSGINIEIHPGFKVVKEERYSLFLKDVFNYLKPVSKYQYQLDKAFELNYLTYHLVKHMHAGGIGLRSILDIGIFINYYKDQIDLNTLNKLLSENNLLHFLKYLIAVNNRLFNFNIELLNNNSKIDNNTLDDLVEYVVASGIHGVGSTHNEFSSRVLNEGKNSKLKFVLRRIFPTVKEMKGIYKILNKVIILLPFMYIIRLIKLVFIKGFINLGKVLKISKTSNKKTEENLFKNIGIKRIWVKWKRLVLF